VAPECAHYFESVDDFMVWLAGVVGLLLIGLLIWLLIITEATYLGARAVACLYNLYARRYDAVKSFEQGYEEAFLGRPMRYAIGRRPEPVVLDVATGTGRIPALLLRDPSFRGKIFALDFARQMLHVAAQRLARHEGQVAWVWQNAMDLPFADERFDLVTCIEALEFMPDPVRVLAEMVRVLQPGGWLLTTRRRGWQSRLFPGKVWKKEELLANLYQLGLRDVRILPWQVDYDLVWASKSGVNARVLFPDQGWREAFLRCPDCGNSLRKGDQLLSCSRCKVCYPVKEWLIELAAGRRCIPAREGQRERDDGETDHPPGRR
jgi:ubiquinone/menaquinone biosynthesis C-methylase UbiE